MYWIAALIVPGAIGALVTPVLPDDSPLERAISGLASGLATFVVVSLCWFAFNLLHAGNRLTIANQSLAISALETQVQQVRDKPAASDEEIIAALRLETKQQMLAQRSDLLAGKGGAGWFADATKAQMQEHELVSINFVTMHAPPSWNAAPKTGTVFSLTPRGIRILQCLIEMQNRGEI